VLSGADIAMVNLETAITDRGDPVAGKNYNFRELGIPVAIPSHDPL